MPGADIGRVLGGLLDAATPFVFFTGKGGVGKTSTAAATAIGLADAGRRVLLVSTDPASNLDEVLGMQAGQSPVPVSEVAGLRAMNIDPETAAAQYREKVIGPYRRVCRPRRSGRSKSSFPGPARWRSPRSTSSLLC
ncbi:ArsA-related P-loop ATPase [Allosaccharopolyspora coralli]|uniref:ArsA-related P-loop ATPase n=1 Tax=Allosaccharopolyspora coralli TaxID=2665642 RepID=UPI002B40CC56|nr:ArsA-related P-loop ATPase [Allosaccharopolyspora coralli]